VDNVAVRRPSVLQDSPVSLREEALGPKLDGDRNRAAESGKKSIKPRSETLCSPYVRRKHGRKLEKNDAHPIPETFQRWLQNPTPCLVRIQEGFGIRKGQSTLHLHKKPEIIRNLGGVMGIHVPREGLIIAPIQPHSAKKGMACIRLESVAGERGLSHGPIVHHPMPPGE
jgi:hypothetical protein